MISMNQKAHNKNQKIDSEGNLCYPKKELKLELNPLQ